jgi:hypothetical protein
VRASVPSLRGVEAKSLQAKKLEQIGVANNTVMTVLDILAATNARTRNGLLYDLDGLGTISASEQALRTQANVVYSAINDLGGL